MVLRIERVAVSVDGAWDGAGLGKLMREEVASAAIAEVDVVASAVMLVLFVCVALHRAPLPYIPVSRHGSEQPALALNRSPLPLDIVSVELSQRQLRPTFCVQLESAPTFCIPLSLQNLAQLIENVAAGCGWGWRHRSP